MPLLPTPSFPSGYRGRLAPSPTGLLHVGHARTFQIAQERCRAAGGVLVLRNEDLDRERCRPEFVTALLEDLRWLGFAWQEGPDVGGPCAPYHQSERLARYRAAFEHLRDTGRAYPCTCSRRDIRQALSAPHAADDEPLYPGTCRPRPGQEPPPSHPPPASTPAPSGTRPSPRCSWRFHVPDGETLRFDDRGAGPQRFVAGVDFGDFVVWRHDDLPAYQLACVVDDAMMGITEVVRGADLLVSTARQLLLYRAFGWPPPAFHHCPLVTDERGVRLAKRHDALSLRACRARGVAPADLWARLASGPWDVHR